MFWSKKATTAKPVKKPEPVSNAPVARERHVTHAQTVTVSRPATAEELFEKHLSSTLPGKKILVEKGDDTFRLVVPQDFSRGELTSAGFTAEDKDQINWLTDPSTGNTLRISGAKSAVQVWPQGSGIQVGHVSAGISSLPAGSQAIQEREGVYNIAVPETFKIDPKHPPVPPTGMRINFLPPFRVLEIPEALVRERVATVSAGVARA